jgi:diguanylate cyclase (GGDEF)-like protein
MVMTRHVTYRAMDYFGLLCESGYSLRAVGPHVLFLRPGGEPLDLLSSSRRHRVAAAVRDLPWWQSTPCVRSYVLGVTVTALAAIGIAAAHLPLRPMQLFTFLILVGCGLASVAAASRIAYSQGGLVRDFLTVWILPVAILLPPFYALIAPIPLLAFTQWRVHRGVLHRRVFSGAAIGLAYGAASVAFRLVPGSVAGHSLGSGVHAVTWTLVVVGCELLAWLIHNTFILLAIKMSDRTADVLELLLNREALQADCVQFSFALLVTIVVAASPFLALFAVPSVLLVRRFLMHSQLVAQTRVDSKTGLLNAATWERESLAEVNRAIRTHTPLSVALLDIDHFKVVNDTYGHLTGDRVLKAVSEALRSLLRPYDLAGRFGGEEFVVLFPQTGEEDARHVAERLRTYIGSLGVPIDDTPDAACVSVTVSVGVAILDGGRRELTELLAAADAALYYAKETGRNRVRVMVDGTSQGERVGPEMPA